MAPAGAVFGGGVEEFREDDGKTFVGVEEPAHGESFAIFVDEVLQVMAGAFAHGDFIDEADVLLIDPYLHLRVHGGGAVDEMDPVAVLDEENIQIGAGGSLAGIGELGKVHRQVRVGAGAKEHARPGDLRERRRTAGEQEQKQEQEQRQGGFHGHFVSPSCGEHPRIIPLMIQIGKLTIDAPFFQAGLAGYSDAAMRLVARRHGAPFAVTEAMLDQFLINGGRGLEAAELDAADHPIAGQLMGSHPDEIAAGAKILVKLGYDVIDVNLACPVKKIRKRARGGHLMQAPDEAIAILDAVRQAVGDDRPCTVKLRRGTDDTLEAERNFHRIFESVINLGYAGAVVHGRTVEQKYAGPSKWAFLKGIVQQYGSLTSPLKVGSKADSELGTRNSELTFFIGGSGDIWCAADIFRMIRETGVQFVSVARGCIGNPWIFHQARAMMAGDLEAAALPPTIGQQREVLLDHFQLSAHLHGEKRAGMMMRKFGIKFSRHHPQGGEVAKAYIAVKSLDDWRAVLDRYYRDLAAPGIVADMGSGPAPVDCEADSCEPAVELVG